MFSRKMSLFNVASLGIGSMVGAGIFALLGQVILSSGNLTYLAFLFAGTMALLCGYSYSKLAEAYPKSGGIIEYFKHALKYKYVISGFSAIYLFTLAISIAMLAKSFGIYTIQLLTIHEKFIPIFGVLIILILSFVNSKNSGIVGRTESFLIILKISLLLALVFIGFYKYLNNINTVNNIFTNPINFWQGVAFAFFSYAGFGVMSNTAGDVKNPKKTIPLAIFCAIFFVILLYNSLTFIILNFVPQEILNKNMDTAISVAANIFFGKYGFIIMTFAGIIALSSGINALLYSCIKIIKSMSQYNELPKILNKNISKKISIGFISLVIFTSLSCIFLRFEIISKISSAFFLLSYMAIFVSHFLLRHKVKANLFFITLGFTSMLFIMIKILASS